MADSQGPSNPVFLYTGSASHHASGYTSSPVEKEKQNYEATAPGNPRFLEQPIQINSGLIRRIMRDV